MDKFLTHINLGYRWVILPKVLDFASPALWHAIWLKEEKNKSPSGIRIVKELEKHIVAVEATPSSVSSAIWDFKGWIIPGFNNYKGFLTYPDLSLECEVLIVSNKPMLTASHHVGIGIDSANDPRALFSDTASEAEYALGILLESHGKATYIKHLLSEVEKEIPSFKLDIVREDLLSLTAFGDAYNGQWSLSLTESAVNKAYEADFTFWRKSAKGIISSSRENNPNIVGEEVQYFSGELKNKSRISLFSRCLFESLAKYN